MWCVIEDEEEGAACLDELDLVVELRLVLVLAVVLNV